MRTLVMTATLVAMAWTHAAFAVEETLQNDGFSTGAAVNFQAGFAAGEWAEDAVRLRRWEDGSGKRPGAPVPEFAEFEDAIVRQHL